MVSDFSFYDSDERMEQLLGKEADKMKEEHRKEQAEIPNVTPEPERPMLPAKALWSKISQEIEEHSTKVVKGRDLLYDAYLEALQNVFFIRQEIEERKHGIPTYPRLCVEWRNAMRLHNYRKAAGMERKLQKMEQRLYEENK